MAELKHTRICEFCGIEFLSKTVATRFCSNKCKDKQRTSKPSIESQCKMCGKHFLAKRRCRSDYCSSKCANKFVNKLRLEALALKRIGNKKAITRGIKTLIELASLLRIQRRNNKNFGSTVGKKYHKNCKSCGIRFTYIQEQGCPPYYCNDCRKNKKIEVRLKGKRIAKAKRRAKERCVRADKIDPFDIFDRDEWTCKICGCKTPKHKRGTYDPDAPELDHILPLSKGGEHKILNVQCACRKCNQSKGNKLLFNLT